VPVQPWVLPNPVAGTARNGSRSYRIRRLFPTVPAGITSVDKPVDNRREGSYYECGRKTSTDRGNHCGELRKGVTD
jgi:hypothetical protein